MDKLLQQFSITEIAKKTHISPIILDKLQNRDFSKMTKIKAIGFVKILEEEYPNYDFSKIKEDIQNTFSQSDTIPIVKEEEILQDDESSKKLYILFASIAIGAILLIFGIYKIFSSDSKQVVKHQIEKNVTKKTPIKKIQPVVVAEVNVSEFNNSDNYKTLEENISTKKDNVEQNITKNTQNDEKITKDVVKKTISHPTLAIIPLKKVWFRVTYLDNFKSKEYLTSHEIDLKTNRPLFIKFGHGFIKLVYNDKTIKPNTKRVVRVVLQNNKLKITNKKVREYK